MAHADSADSDDLTSTWCNTDKWGNKSSFIKAPYMFGSQSGHNSCESLYDTYPPSGSLYDVSGI